MMEDFDFARMGRMQDQAKINLHPYLPLMTSPPEDKDLESNFQFQRMLYLQRQRTVLLEDDSTYTLFV